jgi:hypothetical protein
MSTSHAAQVAQRSIQHAQHQLKTLNLAIEALEAHKGQFTPFELSMLDIVAKNTGATLGHVRAGLGVESYDGPRAPQMLSLTIESFKERAEELKPLAVEPEPVVESAPVEAPAEVTEEPAAPVAE